MHTIADRIGEIYGVIMRSRTQVGGKDKAVVRIHGRMLFEPVEACRF